MPRWGKWLIYLAFFGAMATLILSQLPAGAYSTDLTRVGDGRPALVLAYDISSTGGMEVMKMMDVLREEYAQRAHFLVADLGTPQGSSFAKRHRAINGSVMIYSADAKHLFTIHLPPNTETLRKALEQALSGQG